METQDNEADISRKMPAQSGDPLQGSEKVGLETTTTPLTTTTTTTTTMTSSTTTTTTTTGVEAEQEFREEASVEKENIKDTIDEAETNITETRISEDDEQGGDTGTSPVVSGPAPRFGARHRGRGGTRRVQACTSS